MRISSSAVSLNVTDPEASAQFLVEHFGFHIEMAAPGFASLTRDDAGLNVIYLRVGLPTLPADQRDSHVQGVILAFVVDDLAPGGGWNPRYLEIRGTAEALTDVEPPRSGFSRELIKIHPDWVRSFGLPDPD